MGRLGSFPASVPSNAPGLIRLVLCIGGLFLRGLFAFGISRRGLILVGLDLPLGGLRLPLAARGLPTPTPRRLGSATPWRGIIGSAGREAGALPSWPLIPAGSLVLVAMPVTRAVTMALLVAQGGLSCSPGQMFSVLEGEDGVQDRLTAQMRVPERQRSKLRASAGGADCR